MLKLIEVACQKIEERQSDWICDVSDVIFEGDWYIYLTVFLEGSLTCMFSDILTVWYIKSVSLDGQVTPTRLRSPKTSW